MPATRPSRSRHIYNAYRQLALWAASVDLLLLLGAIIIVAGVWGFVEIAELATSQEPHTLDRWLLEAARNPADPADARGPKWFEEAVRDITALGGVAVLCLATTAAVGFLVISRLYHTAGFLVAAAAGGNLVSLLLKSFFDRPRPDVVPALAYVQTASFPSGHAQLSAVIYLTIGVILARTMPRPVQQIYVISIAILLTLLIGASRVYLGVHYPTDVLAGWLAGLLWSVGCWLLVRILQRKRLVERSSSLSEEQPVSDEDPPQASH